MSKDIFYLIACCWKNDSNCHAKPGFNKRFHICEDPIMSSTRRNLDMMHSQSSQRINDATYLRTCKRSETCERAGVPETANEDSRGSSDTISLKTKSDNLFVEIKRDELDLSASCHLNLGVTTQ
jgi:hypothetical protein